MFGGRYPHDDVKVSHKLSLIQKGVCYTPEHEFYGFDIYIFDDALDDFLKEHGSAYTALDKYEQKSLNK